jgi:hypothetical protein
MSTKTTFKRIALVTVAALGFGVMTSVAPASAAATSFSLNTSSITVVGGSATDTPSAIVRIKVTSDTAGAANVGALAEGESITARVTGVPTNVTATKSLVLNGGAMSASTNDLAMVEVKAGLATPVTSAGIPTYTAAGTTYATATTPDTVTANATAPFDGQIGSENTSYFGQENYSDDTASSKSRYYYVAIMPREAKTVLDQGVYTVTFTLTDASGNLVSTQSLKIDFVANKLDSGSKITITQAGQFKASTALVSTKSSTAAAGTPNLSATLTNRDGGRVVGKTGLSEALTVKVRLADATSDTATAAAADDTAAAGDLGNTTDETLVSRDGVYGITWDASSPAAAGTYGLTVAHGSAVATASIVVVAPTASTTAVATIVAAGQIDSTDAATVPLTTKSAVVSVKVTNGGTAVTGYSMYYTYSYGTSCSAGDMTTKVTTPTKVLTDATGVASFTVANAYPLDGCTATVVWTGAATDDASQVITWKKSLVASAIPSPGGNVQVALKSVNKTTWTIVDQFGAIMVGKTVAISHAGANAPTVAPATVISDANGQVSYSFTDALGVAASTTLGTDTVSVSKVDNNTPTTTAGAIVYTYKTTLDVVASLESTYTLTGGTAVVIPTTTIAGPSNTGIVASANDATDWTVAQAAATVKALTGVVALNFTAKSATPATVSGIPTTVEVTNGFILGADGKLATSRIIYANEQILVVGAKTGVAVVTATNGTVTSKASILFVNAKEDARVISATESAGKITAKAVDWYGNPVAGAVLEVTTSGTGNLGNGASFATFTTASDGTVTFNVVGEASVTIKANPAAKTLNLAGYSDATGTNATPGVAAGVRSVTIATAGLADVASAAADAAAEATDAANAATDAANAAAEAADAATAAAQDAADAVAALSTQVAEMVNALKKQITALTNLVIKIQKKVKA